METKETTLSGGHLPHRNNIKPEMLGVKHTPKKGKRSRKPPKPFSPNEVFVTAKICVAAPGKSCSQCGTTKTPQWREGPLGPKTLCNACGVKRVRAARAAMEGRMRMAKAKKVGEITTRRSSSKGNSTADRAAAFILAAIEEKERDGPEEESKKAGMEGSKRQAASRKAESNDNAMASSSLEEAEEIQFIPPNRPMSPISQIMGEGGVAALGLMSMSLPQEIVQHSMHLYMQNQNQLKDLQSQAKQAAKHAFACDAAVTAVAQVLALKQAVAMKARQEASAAAERLTMASTNDRKVCEAKVVSPKVL